MNKISIRPPLEWPAAAQRAFYAFEAELSSRIKAPRKVLLLLHPYFHRQCQQGHTFEQVPAAFLDGYLETLTANRRRLFLYALSTWLRFLYERKLLPRPLHTELPGGKVHVVRRRVKKLDIRPPEQWPPAACRLFYEYATQLRQRLQSARAYLRELYHFFPYQLECGLEFREFPVELVDAYLAPRTPHARKLFLTALVSWLRFLYARKELLLPLHEEMLERRPVTHSRRALLSYAQVMQVLALPPTDEPEGLRDRALLEMAYGSAMRRSELVYLDLADVDLATGLVSIRQAKNSQQRTVPLTRWALHYLQRYLREARPQLSSPLSLNALWLSQFGHRLDRNTLGKRLLHVYMVEDTVGFAFTLHQLRHACATHLLQAGASLRDVQELLGHLVLQSTQTYTHITLDGLHRLHQRCHPRSTSAFRAPGDLLDPEK